jgi:hypothetical protein
VQNRQSGTFLVRKSGDDAGSAFLTPWFVCGHAFLQNPARKLPPGSFAQPLPGIAKKPGTSTVIPFHARPGQGFFTPSPAR